jgi:hypothetical protein
MCNDRFLRRLSVSTRDNANSRKSADKHDVNQAEAESIFFNDPLIDQDSRRSRAERIRYEPARTNQDRAREKCPHQSPIKIWRAEKIYQRVYRVYVTRQMSPEEKTLLSCPDLIVPMQGAGFAGTNTKGHPVTRFSPAH